MTTKDTGTRHQHVDRGTMGARGMADTAQSTGRQVTASRPDGQDSDPPARLRLRGDMVAGLDEVERDVEAAARHRHSARIVCAKGLVGEGGGKLGDVVHVNPDSRPRSKFSPDYTSRFDLTFPYSSVGEHTITGGT